MSAAEDEIRRKLAALYPPPEWAFFGHTANRTGGTSDERIEWADALAVNLYPSMRAKGYAQIDFEIKASRSDLKRQWDKPRKGAEIRRFCSQTFLVYDSTIARVLSSPGEIDEHVATLGWGVIDVAKIDRGGALERGATLRKTEPIPESFMLAMLRAANYAQTSDDLRDPFMRNVRRIDEDRGVAILSTCEHEIEARLLVKATKGARERHGVHCYECEADARKSA